MLTLKDNYNSNCFHSCLCQNENEYSKNIVSKQLLSIQFKQQKISLKRKFQSKYLTERDSVPYNKKIWQQQTRTGTEVVQKYKKLIKKNIASIKSTNIPQQNDLKNNMFAMNYSTRTFQIPNSQINSIYLNQLNVYPQKKHNTNLIRQSLTERNSINNVKSQPLFQTSFYQNKVTKSMIPEFRPNLNSPQNLVGKQYRRNFQNHYQTVNSEFSNSTIHERVSQSTIQIDFFNPSETRLLNIGIEGKQKQLNNKNRIGLTQNRLK